MAAANVYIARFRRRGVELLTKLMYHVQVWYGNYIKLNVATL